MASEDFAGPVSHAAFVLPRGADPGPAAQELLRAVDSGAVEILDLEVLVRGDDAEVVRASVADHPGLADFEGATTDLLDEEDLALVAGETAAGDLVIVVVYEDRTLAGAAARVRAAGGRELWSGGVAIADLEDAVSDQEETS